MSLQRLLQRLGEAVLSLIVVSFLIHAALDVVPGDAADTLVGDSASTAQMEVLRRERHLEAPFLKRYGQYLHNIVLRGDWGNSFISGRPVAGILWERMQNTVLLAAVSLGLSTTLGIILGVLTVQHKRRWIDGLTIGLTAISMACPTYWTALLFLRIFAVQLRWVPVVGEGNLYSLILPTSTLSLPLMAAILQFVRTHMLTETREPYVYTARAKGATESRVMRCHVLRNSLPPVATAIGLHFGHLLGGTFVVETIFSWPGLGRLMVQAIFDRDPPVVIGAGLLIAAIYIATNLATDLLQEWLDPRTACSAL